MSDYGDKLKDVRWQRVRLEKLNEANWQCEICGNHSGQLQVHHRRYLPDTDPWDYPSWMLRVLCDKCHGEWHDPITTEQLIALKLMAALSVDHYCEGCGGIVTNPNLAGYSHMPRALWCSDCVNDQSKVVAI